MLAYVCTHNTILIHNLFSVAGIPGRKSTERISAEKFGEPRPLLTSAAFLHVIIVLLLALKLSFFMAQGTTGGSYCTVTCRKFIIIYMRALQSYIKTEGGG